MIARPGKGERRNLCRVKLQHRQDNLRIGRSISKSATSPHVGGHTLSDALAGFKDSFRFFRIAAHLAHTRRIVLQLQIDPRTQI